MFDFIEFAERTNFDKSTNENLLKIKLVTQKRSRTYDKIWYSTFISASTK